MADEVIKQTELLAKAIVQSETYSKMKNLEQMVAADSDAKKSVADYIAAQKEVESAISNGDPLKIAVAGENFEKAQSAVDNNSLIVEMRSARSDFSVMMENINRVLRMIVEGESSDPSACTGNCSTCAGCQAQH